MRLYENTELFRDAVTVTAQQKGLPEIYIEKDYWVTYALSLIFEGRSAEYTVFKGETALQSALPILIGSARISTWSLSRPRVYLSMA